MAGRGVAVSNGDELVQEVARRASQLGLLVKKQVSVARRIWGAKRKVDLVLRDATTGKTLGIECKFQGTRGTAEEKLLATIQDINAWPMPGLVVFAGDGFDEKMKAFLISTGKAVELEELEEYLRLYFNLPID